MEIRAAYIKQFKAALREESLRLTNQRLAVLEDILDSGEHRECDDIFLSLRSKRTPVSRATIYRTLDVLERVGFVRKMDIGDGRFRYESKITQPHHDHMVCLQCGLIIEFVDLEIESRQVMVSKKQGFKLSSHSHQLYGICAGCQQQGEG